MYVYLHVPTHVYVHRYMYIYRYMYCMYMYMYTYNVSGYIWQVVNPCVYTCTLGKSTMYMYTNMYQYINMTVVWCIHI